MFFRLLLLFTTIPLIELALLVEVGRYVGLAATIALVITTGILGAWLAKSQGLATLARVQADFQAGRMPAAAMLEGLMILMAGAVLLTPGLLTDLFGFALLTPVVRRAFGRALAKRFAGRFVVTGAPGSQGPFDSSGSARAPGSGASSGGRQRVIIVEPDED